MQDARQEGQNGTTKQALSRRRFLTNTGGLAAGVAVGAGLVSLTSCVEGQPLQVQLIQEPCPDQPATTAASQAVPQWPWPYAKLDVEEVRKSGYQHYYAGGCCYGAFSAVIAALQENVGAPYTGFPVEMMRYGEGGVVGWSTLCGAINGAAAAINLVAGEDYSKLVDELVGWYTEFPFPSEQMNQYASEKILLPEGKPDQPLVSNACGSPLCHESVTKWCLESGYASKSPERAERCARLCGDVAARAVELLNQHADGTFEAVFELPASTQECQVCHFMGESFDEGQFTRGKMECTSCHEPHR